MDLAFDRVTGLLRLVTSSGQNLRINPGNGAVVSSDAAPAFAAGDVNAGIFPQLAGMDYALSNGVQTLYGIDATRDALVRIGSTGGAPLSPDTGQLGTTGALGFDTTAQTALDIPPGAAFGWASLSLPGAVGSGLYAVNLSKGNAVFMGAIRTVEQLRDIAIAPARDVWRHTRFGAGAGNTVVSGDAADPDGNGVTNLMEYALGAAPLNPSSVPMPVVSRTGDGLSLTFTRPTSVTDLTYTVQVSGDLAKWNDGSTYAPAGDITDNAFTTQILRSSSGGTESITVRDNVPVTEGARRFMRLKVTAP